LPKPTAWWKKPVSDENNNDSSIDLALLCWIPDATPRALQRSEELTTNVTNRWEYICKQVAPATTVFYTFNDKALGFNNQGWRLYGSMWPDSPGTTRNTTPNTMLYVYQSKFPFDATDLQEAWLGIRNTVLVNAKVIGYNEIERIKTGRVLQFPFEALYKNDNKNNSKYLSDANKPPDNATEVEIKAFNTVKAVRKSVIEVIKKFEPENIIIDCGELAKADLLLSMPIEFVQPKNIIFRTLDKNFKVIKEQTAEQIGFTAMPNFTDLPSNWQQTSGPWANDAVKVWRFISTLSKQRINAILVHYSGFDKMQYIQIVVKRQINLLEPPSLLLCAIETLTKAEWQREQFETTIKTEDKKTVETALAGEKLRPLLKPNTVYDLTVNYDYEQQVEGTTTNITGSASKTFSFKTDDKAPLRIDPWILTCTPQNDMRYHFIDDAVQIYFNDLSIFQLYKAYGITLTAKVKNANGLHPLQKPDEMRLSGNNLLPKAASILTPWLDTANAVAGRDLPCINSSGVKEDHQVFRVICPLLKNTEYTVEIEKEGVAASTANDYKTPMYKIAFKTSKYQNVNEFANDIKSCYIKTKVLSSTLVVLDEVCSDNEMENALNQAGLPSSKAAAATQVTLLWTSIQTGAIVQTTLAAILIETPEPTWRYRPYPDIETITTEKGFMKQWIMKPKAEMQFLEDASTAAVQKIVHTQGGGKTIFYLKPTAAGSLIKLNIRKHVFTLKIEEYNTAAFYNDINIINLKLPAVAPWDEQD
jgi:large repetitive protein